MRSKLSYTKTTRIFLAILFATIAFTQWGYFWYAMLFDDLWQYLIGRSEQELIQFAEQRGWIQSFNTYFISLVQVCGLMILSLYSRKTSFLGYQTISAICSILITIPVLGNAVLFAGQSSKLWVLDFAHFVIGYAGIALVFWLCTRTEIKTSTY